MLNDSVYTEFAIFSTIRNDRKGQYSRHTERKLSVTFNVLSIRTKVLLNMIKE